MKLDHGYVRHILIVFESLDGYPDTNQLYKKLTQFSPKEQFDYTFKKLIEAGFVKGINASGMTSFGYISCEITWDGHAFLDNIKNDTIWKQTTKTVFTKVGDASLQIISQVAAAIIAKQMGL